MKNSASVLFFQLGSLASASSFTSAASDGAMRSVMRRIRVVLARLGPASGETTAMGCTRALDMRRVAVGRASMAVWLLPNAEARTQLRLHGHTGV